MLRPAALRYLVPIAIAPLYAVPVPTLRPSPESPRPVGHRITWTAAATDTDPGEFTYRFQVRPPGQTNFNMIVDFGNSRGFNWTPSEHEGIYEVRVSVKNTKTGQIGRATATFQVTTRIRASGNAVVSSTRHPLVALYSVPPCPEGSQVQVLYQSPMEAYRKVTPRKNCKAGLSVNFYIGGMHAETSYTLRHELITGNTVTESGVRMFRTGSLEMLAPPLTETNPADQPTSLTDGIVLHTYNAGGDYRQTATDLAGRVVWYTQDANARIYRPGPEGTFLMVVRGRIFRQIDLVGNVLAETSINRINDQLRSMGRQTITSLHHDVQRLPNGHTVLLCSNERLVTNVQEPGTVDVIGDSLAVLDENLQLVWEWNAFDHLDLRRKATLDEKCPFSSSPGCPPFSLAPTANDWLHANSVAPTPDGHLIMSLRHQDWVIKIDYGMGTGSGRVLWRLGKDGDFSIDSTDPYPWFSHQHDAEFDDPAGGTLSLYDNGNLRREISPTANSRGQAFRLDEVGLRATPVLNADLGHYSFAVGSAQRLSGGSYHFLSGIIDGTTAQTTETRTDGVVTFRLTTPQIVYRSHRMQSIYVQSGGVSGGPFYR